MREITVGLERSRFAENLNISDLLEMEGQRESADSGLSSHRNLIVHEKQQPPRLMMVLSSSLDETIAADRTELRKHYKQSGSYAEALLHSLYEFFPGNVDAVHSLTQPRSPDLMKEFKRFQKEIRAMFKERGEYLRENPVHNYYAQVSSKKNLDEDQSLKRDWLLKQKDLNPAWFNEHWKTGIFHRLTWIYRLQNTQLSEAQLIASALKLKESEFKIEDYGFTDVEIQNGFQHSGQFFERILFRSFISGDRNLSCFVEIYKKLSVLTPQAKFKITKLSTFLVMGEAMSDEDYQWTLKLLSELKIPLALFIR